MKATFKQLQFVENVEKNYCLTYLDYGFYSNGSIGVQCKDQFGEFSIKVNEHGETT